MGLDIHGKTLNQGRVNVLASSPATIIVPLNPKRSRVSFQVTDPDNYVFLGNSGVILGQGIGLVGAAAGTYERQIFTMHTKAAVYGMAEDHDQNVLWLEETE